MADTPAPSRLAPTTSPIARSIEQLASALRWSLIAVIAVMTFCIALQVLMRYVFAQTPAWTEELAILMFAWGTLGSLALGVREGFHVRMMLLLDRLSGRAHEWAERSIELLTAALGAYLALAGWRYVDMTLGARSAAIQYPIEILHGLAPLSGLLIFVFALERAWRGPQHVAQQEVSA